MNWGFTELLCPYLSWENESVRELTNEMMAIKKSGYSHNYKNVLPIDSLDMISDHYLLWIEENGIRKYIAGMKGINYATVTYFKQSFPCESLLQAISKVCAVDDHLKAFHNIIKSEHDFEKIRYYNGWTMRPEHRGRDEHSRKLVNASVATIAFAQIDHRASIGLGSGMPHLKTDQVFREMGYFPWTLDGVELPSLPSPGYDLKHTIFIVWRENPEAYMNKVEKFQGKWNEREIVGTQLSEYLQKEAA